MLRNTRHDRNLKDLTAFFEKALSQYSYENNVLNIFTGMISEEKYDFFVTLPYLTLLFKNCSNKNGYWTFIENIYQSFMYDGIKAVFTIFSPVHRELLFREDYSVPAEELNLPPVSEDFLDRKWVIFREDHCDSECPYKNKWNFPCYKKRSNDLLDIADPDCQCRNHYSDSEIVSKQYIINFKDVFQNQNRYHDLFQAIDGDDFPLKQEYHDLYELWHFLLSEYARHLA